MDTLCSAASYKRRECGQAWRKIRLHMPILPDVLQANLRLVFCGTAPSRKSAQLQAYYAHPGNLFWKTLFAAGFLPEALQPQDYQRLPEFGFGLTDLNKRQFGVDAELDEEQFDVAGLQEKLRLYRPRVLAFTSKQAGSVFLGDKHLTYGAQPEPFAATQLWVLPSTSGSARPHWARLQHYWFELGALLAHKI
jgi:TDG/mug DNA glycosylase family protein